MNAYVRDWMTPDPIVGSPAMTLAAARQQMATAGIRHLPIVVDGQLVGLISKRDLRRAELEQMLRYANSEIKLMVRQVITVGDILTGPPPSIRPDTTIAAAARLLLHHHLTALTVVADDRLVGIITESDLFRILAEEAPPAITATA